MKWLVLIIFLLISSMAVGIQTAHAQYTDNSDNVICSECGQKNSTDGLFCAGCGVKLVQPPKPLPEKKSLQIKKIPNSDVYILEKGFGNKSDKKKPQINNSSDPQDVISNMSREDLIRLIELLTDKSYNKPQRFNPNLVGNMTRMELESLIKNNSNQHTSTKQNGFQIFLQVVGFITTLTFVIVILA